MGRAQKLSLHPPETTARAYAGQLLASLGRQPLRPLALRDEHPALSAASSGLLALTGRADGPPQLCPVPLAGCADGVLAALASLAPVGAFAGLRGSRLLTERAALAGYSRQGAISPGGSCRLLAATDGWLALNLAREDDWQLLPAWLEAEVARDWSVLAALIRTRPVAALVARGRLLGLALAPQAAPANLTRAWFRVCHQAPRALRPAPPASRAPLVVDLSALWAGPLCAHLLHLAGAEVIKLESLQRPDGARQGPAAFFDLLNAGKRSVALDFTSAQGHTQLRALLAQADIVIESSRPRALRQLGICAETLLDENPQLTWLSISGYGRGEPQENQIAYGDDAGVAAGLSQLLWDASGEPLFCGDAIADPLTGLHAALAAWAGFQQGGGQLLSLGLCEVVGHCIAFDPPATAAAARQRAEDWAQLVYAAHVPGGLPPARAARGVAASLGADTEAVLTQLALV